MSDTKLRDLEKRWKESHSDADEAAYLRERHRVGDLSEERLQLAAACGHAASQAALGKRPAYSTITLLAAQSDDPPEWAARCTEPWRFGDDAARRVVFSVLEGLLERHPTAVRDAPHLQSVSDRLQRLVDLSRLAVVGKPVEAAVLREASQMLSDHLAYAPIESPAWPQLHLIELLLASRLIPSVQDLASAFTSPDFSSEPLRSDLLDRVRQSVVPWALGSADPLTDTR